MYISVILFFSYYGWWHRSPNSLMGFWWLHQYRYMYYVMYLLIAQLDHGMLDVFSLAISGIPHTIPRCPVRRVKPWKTIKNVKAFSLLLMYRKVCSLQFVMQKTLLWSPSFQLRSAISRDTWNSSRRDIAKFDDCREIVKISRRDGLGKFNFCTSQFNIYNCTYW